MIQTRWFHRTDNMQDVYAVRRQAAACLPVMDASDFSAYTVVVYERDLPVASGRLWKKNGVFLIDALFVLADKRGYGYGDLVMRVLIRKAFCIGDKEVWLFCLPGFFDFFSRYQFQKAELADFDVLQKNDVAMVCRKDVGGQCTPADQKRI